MGLIIIGVAPVSLLPDTGRFEFPVGTANLEWLYRHSSVVIASFGDRQGNRGQMSLTIRIWGAMMEVRPHYIPPHHITTDLRLDGLTRLKETLEGARYK